MQYFIILILSVCLFGLFYKYPKLILPFLIFAIPLQRYNVYVETINLSVKAILIILPCAYLALFVRKKIVFPQKTFLLFSLLLLLGEVFSLLGSINYFRSISVISFSCLTLSYSYLFLLLIKDKNTFMQVISCFLIAGSVVSLLGLWQFFRFNNGKSVSLPFENSFNSKTISAEAFEFRVGDTTYLRPSSTFVDVNITSGFLAIIVLLNLAVLLGALTKTFGNKYFWLYIASFLVNLSAFLLTVSRSGYLGFSIGLIVVFVLNKKVVMNKRVLLFFVFLLFLVGLVVLFADTPLEAMWGRFQDTFVRHDVTGSTQEHSLFSQSAIRIFTENTWFGVGAGNFEEYYLTYIDTAEDTAYTYNVYLGFLSEMGLIGFFTQLSFIFFVIYSSFRSLLSIKDSELRLIFSALFGSFLSVLVANLFYAYYILFFVWLLIGLLMLIIFNRKIFYNEEKYC